MKRHATYLLLGILPFMLSCSRENMPSAEDPWHPGCMVTAYIVEPELHASPYTSPPRKAIDFRIGERYEGVTSGYRIVSILDQPRKHAAYARRYGDTCFKGVRLKEVLVYALAEPLAFHCEKGRIATPGQDTVWYDVADSLILEWTSYWPAVRKERDADFTDKLHGVYQRKNLSRVTREDLSLINPMAFLRLCACHGCELQGSYRVTVDAGWGAPQRFLITF